MANGNHGSPDAAAESSGSGGSSLLVVAPNGHDAAQAAAAAGNGSAQPLTQRERLNKSLRRSLEVSLNFLQKTNAHAYALLAVLTLLPGGATTSDLDAIWQPDLDVLQPLDRAGCTEVVLVTKAVDSSLPGGGEDLAVDASKKAEWIAGTDANAANRLTSGDMDTLADPMKLAIGGHRVDERKLETLDLSGFAALAQLDLAKITPLHALKKLVLHGCQKLAKLLLPADSCKELR